MNKSEIELQNITNIIGEMPPAEQEKCKAMIASLMASIGNPVHGQTFMIAVAYANCQVAVHNIKMGLVNQDGSIPEKFMQGDGKAYGGLNAEVLAVDEMAVVPAWATHKLQDGDGVWHFVREYLLSPIDDPTFVELDLLTNEPIHFFTKQSYVDGSLTKLDR